jgi:uncharacterized membrane protein YqiK
MTAIAVSTTKLPQSIIVLSEHETENRAALLAKITTALAAPITTETAAQANDAYTQCHRWLKDLEANRQTVKRPLLDLGKQVDDVAKKAAADMEAAKLALGRALAAYQQQENARIQAERDRIAAEARAEQERREAEAKALQDKLNAEAAERAALETIPGEEPAPVLTPQVLVRPAELMPQHMPELVKTAVKVGVKKVLHIDDYSAIPFEVNGVPLWKELDRTAVTTLLKNNVAVPGCRLIEETAIGAKGI